MASKIQTIFDTITAHLRQQGKRAYDNFANACAYRTTDRYEHELKCAAGCLIPDDAYWAAGSNIEGNLALEIHVKWPNIYGDNVSPVGTKDWEEEMALIRVMQQIHDTLNEEVWEEYWQTTANSFGLEFTPNRALRDMSSSLPDLETPTRKYGEQCVREEIASCLYGIKVDGQLAAQEGRSLEANPFTPSGFHDAWAEGWKSALIAEKPA